jgi:hypothetical protein
MAFSFKRIVKGILLRGETSDDTSNLEGSVWHNSTSNDLKSYIGGAVRTFVFGDKTQTLTNNTIDADNNTISNLEVDNLKLGVLDTDLNSVSTSDDTIPSAKAVKDYIDQQDRAQDEASEISYDNATSGLTATNVQDAIDEVDGNTRTAGVGLVDNGTDLDVQFRSNSDADKLAVIDADGQGLFINRGAGLNENNNDLVVDLSSIEYDNTTSGLTATLAEAAIDEIDANVDTLNNDLINHIADTSTHGITSTIVGTDETQTLINKTIDVDNNAVSNIEVDNLKAGVLDTDLSSVSASDDTIPSAKATKAYVDSVAAAQNEASEITYSNATSGLVATNVQTAIDEVEGRVDTSDSHIAASSGVHGVTGDVVGTTDTQTLTNKSIDADNNTISNLEHGAEVDNPTSGVHGVTGNIVGTSDTQTLTNKTLDADNNTVNNIEVDNLKAGVLDTDLSTVSGSDDTLASAKAIKTYVDSQVSAGSVIKYDSGWVTVNTINDTPATGTHRLTTTLSAYPSQISLTLDDGTNIFPGDMASRLVFREITGTYYVEIDCDGLDSTDKIRVHAWV